VDNDDARWDVPYPYGQAAAIDSMGGIAAPLLAGFAVTIALLVFSTPHAFRFVSLTLGLLVVAAFALIAALQFTFRARQYSVTPAEIEVWWPDAKSPERRQELEHEQREHRAAYKRWSNKARWAYNAGILLFVCGLTAALFPPGSIGGARLLVIVLALLAAAAEFCWIANDAKAR
jgi:hypothetical protein